MSVDGPQSLAPGIDPFDQILARTQRQRRLFTAHWELTYRCNEKCTHCYLDVFAPHAKVPDELTTEECLRIVDQMAELGVLNLTLSGGEILVRRDFFEIAEYARSKRFLLRLFTNGILITPAVADRIAALHPYSVELSLYSATPELHDRITRVRRSWELTTRAFGLLREHGIRSVMKTPLMRENARELKALRALANDLGSSLRYDLTITQKDSGGIDPLKHRLTDDDLLWVMREEMEADKWVQRHYTDESRTCSITLNGIVIDPYGQVSPCIQVRKNAGNLRTQPLKEIWETSPVWKEFGSLTLGALPVCRTCELNSICVRCHGLAMAEDGDIKAPALVNCREALTRRQVLIEKGRLPADFPIPAHLKAYVNGRVDSSENRKDMVNFIPVDQLSVRL